MQPTIQAELKKAATLLIKVTTSPQLEAEILLAEIIKVTRSYLHAYPEQMLTLLQLTEWQEKLQRRLANEPLAYIIGKQGFWDLEFKVTPAVLIPRPETELLIEIIFQTFTDEKKLQVIDLGTGSGAIALTLAKHRPHWQLYAVDQSEAALQIARENAAQLQIENIIFIQGNWCDQLPHQQFDMIVSNPPYIASDDSHLTDLKFEPPSALIAGVTGLTAFQVIISQARHYLKKEGMLLLEHGYEQAEAVSNLLIEQGFHDIKMHTDLQGHPRVTTARN